MYKNFDYQLQHTKAAVELHKFLKEIEELGEIYRNQTYAGPYDVLIDDKNAHRPVPERTDKTVPNATATKRESRIRHATT